MRARHASSWQGRLPGRRVLIAAAVAGLVLTPIAASASSSPVTEACAPIEATQVSDAQATNTLAYWTDAQTADSVGFDSPAGAKARADSAVQTSGRLTAASSECQPMSADAPAAESAPAAGPLAAGPLAAGPVTAGAEVAAAPTSQAVTDSPTVGKFFFKLASVGNLNCTATAINDAAGNPKRALIVTAAHCFKGTRGGGTYTTNDWMFAPKWNHNQFPYGKWAVQDVFMDSRWVTCNLLGCHENPRYDYAVVVLRPNNGHGVGYYTGQDGWNVNMPRTQNVRIVGIPGNASSALVSITQATTVTVDGYLARKAATPGFGEGASGGPWFSSFNTTTQTGQLLGDTGGYHEGGPTDSPSYSSFWQSDFASLVATAAKHE